jgi:predicted NUDIX family NTP pyrophosphohydrolase
MSRSMAARSAGLLQYRTSDEGVLEVLLVHPGGPFWARRDDGAWSVPKGEYGAGEDPRAAAAREFEEETGLPAADTEGVSLGEVRQPGGKRVVAWAVEGDLDVIGASSNTFELEWPRGSGRMQTFPEVDRVEWMSVSRARAKLLKGQLPFLDRLLAVASEGGGPSVTEGPDL